MDTYVIGIKIAQWRYAQIKSVLDVRLTGKDRAEALQEVSSKSIRWPSGIIKTVSLDTLYRWCRKYETGGFDALMPKVSLHHNSARYRYPEQIVMEAIELLREDPNLTLSALTVRLKCIQGNGRKEIPVSTLQRLLARHPGYSELKALKALKRRCPIRRIVTQEINVLDEWRKSNDKKLWQKATIISDCGHKDLQALSDKVEVSLATAYRWIRIFNTKGLESLSLRSTRNWNVSLTKAKTVQEQSNRLLEILHRQPREFSINRASWNHKALANAYENTYGQRIGKSTVGNLLRRSGYTMKKARRVLTSPDPEYREKVEQVLNTLQNLKPDELFFFIDELGPLRVKKYGGRTLAANNDVPTFPQRQAHKGSITMAGGLSATTNQVTWLFSPAKDTQSMIDLIEILYNQHPAAARIFLTWDAASWHSSVSLIEWLDVFNAQTTESGIGPVIQLVPLPTSSQFLDVLEAVFSGMKRAVVHHSDYQSVAELKTAVSSHFAERNAFFKENPKRAGKKIWDVDFFHDTNNLRSGDYREW
jgi:transposase